MTRRKNNVIIIMEKGSSKSQPERIVWVTGYTNFLNEYFIGRPVIYSGNKAVVAVTELGHFRSLPLQDIHNLKKLSFNPSTSLITKLKFEERIWVTGNTNDTREYFIGTPCVHNGIELLALVTHNGIHRRLPLDEAYNLKQLSIIKTNSGIGEQALPSITCSFLNKPCIYIIDILIVKLLNSINNKN